MEAKEEWEGEREREEKVNWILTDSSESSER